MKTTLLMAGLALVAACGVAHARTFHFSCVSNDADVVYYAFTVNEGTRTAKLIKRSPTVALGTFRVLNVASEMTCAKYGWNLSDGAIFCTATQGYGNLQWRGMDLECNSADTE